MKYNLTRDEMIEQVKAVSKHTADCCDVMIKDRDEKLSFNKMVSKYGKKYGTALVIIAQGELEKWRDDAKIEEMQKKLDNNKL